MWTMQALVTAPHLELKGTGGEVDAIPVFDEQGFLIDVFFDDPKSKIWKSTNPIDHWAWGKALPSVHGPKTVPLTPPLALGRACL